MQRRSIALWRRSPQGPTIDGTYATCVAASPHAHCVGAAVYPATYAYVPAGTLRVRS
ncbi:hypothetical protein CHLRE_07g325742v5 [Chlamydomonas reinhardtii]|uniref:Uncharacterized protein n=1 Tax=Chlamydomonas reinhardtii TaxID=3055 RepID=A0A2K3DJG6_CHLRE|nr:uncharacterized protein CHLRE_07g325742v5 [Chlamydomonas reinhardtii]PNW80668.1 hypothetical protein CHLRE_07g325742v5 [Chlamydomonas reinhardtii]